MIGAALFFAINVNSLADALDHWTSNVINTNPSQPIAAIAYGNGVYVAGGDDGGDPGVILSSPDCLNWTLREYSTTNRTVLEIASLAYGAGTFAAVGGGASIYASTNGIDWVAPQSPVLVGAWENVTWGNGTFVAVGEAQTLIGFTTTTSNIMTSPDGINWTGRESAPVAGAATNLNCIAYGNGAGFVAVGDGGKYFTSPDGTNWTVHASSVGHSLSQVVYGNGIFLVSYGSSTNLITKSNTPGFPPQPPWSYQLQGSGTAVNFGCLAFVNGLFIAAGHSTALNTNVLLTSPDGVNWSQRSFYYGSTIYGMIFDGRRMVAVGFDGTNSLAFTSAPLISLGLTFNGSPQLNLSGVVGLSYRIDYLNQLPSTGANWQPLTNFTLPSSPYTYTDTQTSNSTSRYYRAILLP